MASIDKSVRRSVQRGLVGLVLFFLLTPVFGEWLLIEKRTFPTGAEFRTFIDDADVRSGNQGGAASVLYDFQEPQQIGASGPHFQSMVIQFLGDCSNRKVAAIASRSYKGRMESGGVVEEGLLQLTFETVESGSNWESILNFMCAPGKESADRRLEDERKALDARTELEKAAAAQAAKGSQHARPD